MDTEHNRPDHIPGDTHSGLKLYHCERHNCDLTIEGCRKRKAAAEKYEKGGQNNSERYPFSLGECINCEGLNMNKTKDIEKDIDEEIIDIDLLPDPKSKKTKIPRGKIITCKKCGKQKPHCFGGMCDTCHQKEERKFKITLNLRRYPEILEMLRVTAKAQHRTVFEQAIHYIHLGCENEANS